MRRLRGFTLIELLIVVAIIAILAAIAVPNFLEAQVRAKVSRTRADLRSLATGLESYFIDNNAYPVHTIDSAGDLSIDDQLDLGTGNEIENAPTFRVRDAGDEFHTLTTPSAFLTSYFSDPFALTRGLSVRYWANTCGWIAWGIGPDSDEQEGSDIGNDYRVSTDDFESAYNCFVAQPSNDLVTGGGGGTLDSATADDAFTYDPTNGTTSVGDVYRVRQ
jgi:prepilin-type N-terminal cleavage/methylation domain-containing protein